MDLIKSIRLNIGLDKSKRLNIAFDLIKNTFVGPYFAAWFDDRSFTGADERYSNFTMAELIRVFARFTLISWGINCQYLSLKLVIFSALLVTFGDSMFLGSVTNWITSLFANIGYGWCFSLIYFPPPSIDTNIKTVFKGVIIDNECYCPNNMPWKF